MQKSDLKKMRTYSSNHLILVIDFEMTCDEQDYMPKNEMEIIEIGAIWATAAGHVLAEFQTLVRPVLHTQLTPYCLAFIGITQAEIDAAPLFPAAAERLSQFVEIYKPAETLWSSWGKSDATQFSLDCERHGTSNPLATLTHVNLKREFAKRRGGMKQVGMKKALELIGQSIEGTHHRGLDDARNIAKLLPWTLLSGAQ